MRPSVVQLRDGGSNRRAVGSSLGSSIAPTVRHRAMHQALSRALPDALHRALPDALSTSGLPDALMRRRKDLIPLPQSKLRLFLDSADMLQWQRWHNVGIFHGITTNPVILERDGVPCNLRSLTALAREAFDIGASEVQLQSWGSGVQKLSSNAFDLAGIDPKRVVVKLPCTYDGIQTAALLAESHIRVTITGIYSAHQVLLAEAVGAEYAAPYLGRMNDAYGAGKGTAQVTEMQQIIKSHEAVKLRLLVASVRDPNELAHLSALGCDTFTISPAVATSMFNVMNTMTAAADFEAAAERNAS